jgi:hypothetical protein
MSDDDARPEALIAGTLCLMSCYAQHASPAYAARVADNLLRLAGAGALTPEFRTVCHRMAARWRGLEDDARRSAEVEPAPDRRTLQ